jgi:hypothetical protein
MRPSYPLARTLQKRPGQKTPHLSDPVFRSHIIAIASTGMSRRGVAQRAGVPHSSLHDWLERGRAHPDDEMYGTFARDFLLAERGLDQASSTATALRTQALLEVMQDWAEWRRDPGPPPVRPAPPEPPPPPERDADDAAWHLYADELGAAHERYQGELDAWEREVLAWKEPPKLPGAADFEWLLRVQASRYPEDYGTHPHRRPEAEPSGDAWLERNGITHAQLVHMLKQPPEAIGKALVEAGDEVYALLVASGWRPRREAADQTR